MKALEGMKMMMNKWRKEEAEKPKEDRKPVLKRWKKCAVKEEEPESFEAWKKRRSQQVKRKASDTTESTNLNTLHSKACKSETGLKGRVQT